MGHILSKCISISNSYLNTFLGLGKDRLDISINSHRKERIKILELEINKCKQDNETLKLRLDRQSHLNQF